MKRLYVKLVLRLRWAWFHISPRYVKFYMSDTEAHFQDMKLNTILSDYRL